MLFLSQTLQGLQTLKQHYFSKNAHGMINEPNWPKKDSNQVYCICFSFCQLCPKLYIQLAILVGFPLDLRIQVPS